MYQILLIKYFDLVRRLCQVTAYLHINKIIVMYILTSNQNLIYDTNI